MRNTILTTLLAIPLSFLIGCGGASSRNAIHSVSCPYEYAPISLELGDSQQKLSLNPLNQEENQKPPKGFYALSQIDVHYSQTENSYKKPIHIHIKKTLQRSLLDPTAKPMWVTSSVCGLGVDYELIKTLDTSINTLTSMETVDERLRVFSVKSFRLYFEPSPKGEKLAFKTSDVGASDFNSPQEVYQDAKSLFSQNLDKRKNPINRYTVRAVYEKNNTQLFIQSTFRLCSKPQPEDKGYKEKLEKFKICSITYDFK